MTPVAGKVQDWFRAGLGLVYPEICQLCHSHRAAARDGLVCPQCWSQVRFIRPPFCERCGLPFAGDLTTTFECTNCRELELHFSSARSAVVAKTVVLEAIHRFKYSRALWFENFLADLLVREAAPALRGQNWDFIVPVPLHPLKLREREFNQAEMLARALERGHRHSVERKNSPPRPSHRHADVAHARAARREHEKRLCRPPRRCGWTGKRIVIVDDVFTTGATTSACAQALRGAGAAEVCVWTVARGL